MPLSEEIMEKRRGNITASAAYRMMSGWDAEPPSREYSQDLYNYLANFSTKPLVGVVKNAGFKVSGDDISLAWKARTYDNQKPAGLVTYAEELACKSLFSHDPMTDVNTKAMQFGNDREPEAVEIFIEETGLRLINTGDDQVHETKDGIGSTPDGLIVDDIDLIEAGAEVKSRIPIHHARQLLINDNASLIRYDFERFCQIQTGCFVFDVKKWYSISYNPYAYEAHHRLHYCIINRDEVFLSVFKKRAEQVYAHKELYLKKLLAVKNPDKEERR